MNDFNFKFVPLLTQLPGDVVCLPERKLRSTGAYPQPQLSAPCSELASALAGPFSSAVLVLSCKLKIFLKASIRVVTSGPAVDDFSRVIGVCQILFTI